MTEKPLATSVPPPQPPLEGYTFEGFRNPDGSVGTKNVLGISMSVQCVAGVMGFAIDRIKKELLPRYPNVDDVIAIEHAYGCGVAINAPEAVVPIRTLQNIARNPNLGGAVMVVGLGCEKLQPERLLPQREDKGAEASIVSLQDERHRGFGDMVASIMEMADKRLAELNERRRETCPASDLVVGLQCGGSDAFSGVTANPAVGYAADLLVRAGATVMFSEVTEVRDDIHLLTPRAVDAEVGRAPIREMDWYDRYLSAGQRLRLPHTATGVGLQRGGLHHRPRHALRPRHGSGHQGVHPHGPGRTLARPDRRGRRPDRDWRGDHRGHRVEAVPPDPGGGERPEEDLGRPLGPAQRDDAVQPRPGDVKICTPPPMPMMARSVMPMKRPVSTTPAMERRLRSSAAGSAMGPVRQSAMWWPPSVW